jgi:hypothetical protein
MKRALLYLIVLLFPLSLLAQQIDEQSKKLIDEYIKSQMSSETKPIDAALTSKVFNGSFYMTELMGPYYPDKTQGRRPYDSFVFNISQNKVTEFLVEPNNLIPLIKKEFRLKDEPNAVLFEKALYAFYPVRDDVKKSHLKKVNQWIFLAKDEYANRAFIITIDAAGNVKKIENEMNYEIK